MSRLLGYVIKLSDGFGAIHREPKPSGGYVIDYEDHIVPVKNIDHALFSAHRHQLARFGVGEVVRAVRITTVELIEDGEQKTVDDEVGGTSNATE